MKLQVPRFHSETQDNFKIIFSQSSQQQHSGPCGSAGLVKQVELSVQPGRPEYWKLTKELCVANTMQRRLSSDVITKLQKQLVK